MKSQTIFAAKKSFSYTQVLVCWKYHRWCKITENRLASFGLWVCQTNPGFQATRKIRNFNKNAMKSSKKRHYRLVICIRFVWSTSHLHNNKYVRSMDANTLKLLVLDISKITRIRMCVYTIAKQSELWMNLSWSVELFVDFRMCIKNLAIMSEYCLRPGGSKHHHPQWGFQYLSWIHRHRLFKRLVDRLQLQCWWLYSDKRFQDEKLFDCCCRYCCHS